MFLVGSSKRAKRLRAYVAVMQPVRRRIMAKCISTMIAKEITSDSFSDCCIPFWERPAGLSQYEFSVELLEKYNQLFLGKFIPFWKKEWKIIFVLEERVGLFDYGHLTQVEIEENLCHLILINRMRHFTIISGYCHVSQNCLIKG